jgi:NADPH:quinone reductase-like Zn-dependent oxidoreductase
MRAVVCSEYNSLDHISLRDVPRPRIESPGDILVRVVCSSVQTADWRVRSLEMPRCMATLARLAFGWRRPRQPILGTDFAGVVVEVGAEVRDFSVGDAVLGTNGGRFGAHAEFTKARQGGVLCKIPAGLTFASAAAIPFGGLTALDYLRHKARVQAGDRVLVLGSSGAVGVAAVQIATFLGAHVTAVASGRNFSWLEKLGAKDFIDYTTDSVTSSGKTFDVVLDSVGVWNLRELKHLARRGGRLLLISAGLGEMLQAPFSHLLGGPHVYSGLTYESSARLMELLTWTTQGQFQPVIDKIYPCAEAADAHRHVASRHKRGNVIVSFDDSAADQPVHTNVANRT